MEQPEFRTWNAFVSPQPGENADSGDLPAANADGADAQARAAEISRLFREHNRALVNFVLTRVANEQEAKEVAQEAYVRLLQLDRSVAVSYLRWHLFKIAKHIAVDRYRQQATRTRLDRLDVFEYAALPKGEEPLDIGKRRIIAKELWEHWNMTWRGQIPSVSVNENAITSEATPLPGSLIVSDAKTGATRVVADGRYQDLAVSQDGRHLGATQVVGFAAPEGNKYNANEGTPITKDLHIDLRQALGRSQNSAPTGTTPSSVPRQETAPPAVTSKQAFQMNSPHPGDHLLASSALSQVALYSHLSDNGDQLLLKDANAGVTVIDKYNSWLPKIEKTEWQSFPYQIKRGLELIEVKGCILLPPHFRSGRRYPTILSIYPGQGDEWCEGPSMSDERSPGHKAGPYSDHLLAARGFVVFKPNLSESLARTATGPLTEMTDLAIQGLDDLVAKGIADVNRTAIIGISQGGFASLWMATQTDRIKAVVSINGWSDMYSHYFEGKLGQEFYGNEIPFTGEASRYEGWAAVGGLGADPAGDVNVYLNNSPPNSCERSHCAGSPHSFRHGRVSPFAIRNDVHCVNSAAENRTVSPILG